MQSFIAAFVVFLLVFLAMGIGYILKKRTITGSCGGLASVGIEKACDCDTPCAKRQQAMAKAREQQENAGS